MYIEKLASQIKNDILSGLRGYHSNLSLNIQQLQDEIVQCRLSILSEYFMKGFSPIKDLLMSINCIDVDCGSLERCGCDHQGNVAHFQIPQVVTTYGKDAISYIGSTDRLNKFTIVTSLSEMNTYKYRKRGKNKPYVWIDFAPNSEGMLDCYLFNAPFVQQVSVVAVFKDPRDLYKYSCCRDDKDDSNETFIDQLIKEKLTAEKIRYYRQYAAPVTPNTQQYS